ncbi:MAG: hypothetical protein M2R45_04201 [Verrucomicrobia subdivision 3 bacterium]|nr:hypothetical protein [Limisphaerales bacterium]MCS1417062.1 hypothetical protein [Limisphaerales bacterium]
MITALQNLAAFRYFHGARKRLKCGDSSPIWVGGVQFAMPARPLSYARRIDD